VAVEHWHPVLCPVAVSGSNPESSLVPSSAPSLVWFLVHSQVSNLCLRATEADLFGPDYPVRIVAAAYEGLVRLDLRGRVDPVG